MKFHNQIIDLKKVLSYLRTSKTNKKTKGNMFTLLLTLKGIKLKEGRGLPRAISRSTPLGLRRYRPKRDPRETAPLEATLSVNFKKKRKRKGTREGKEKRGRQKRG